MLSNNLSGSFAGCRSLFQFMNGTPNGIMNDTLNGSDMTTNTDTQTQTLYTIFDDEQEALWDISGLSRTISEIESMFSVHPSHLALKSNEDSDKYTERVMNALGITPEDEALMEQELESLFA